MPVSPNGLFRKAWLDTGKNVRGYAIRPKLVAKTCWLVDEYPDLKIGKNVKDEQGDFFISLSSRRILGRGSRAAPTNENKPIQ